MKINARNRVLALLLTLAMLLPNLTGLVPAVQAAEVTTGTANVYDIYDLTGSQTNTVKGTDNGGWSGQKVADVNAEHKENIVFKTKLTMNVDYVRLSLNALADANKVDPAGYAVYIVHNGGAPYVAIKRNQGDLVLGYPASVQGTHAWEFGIVDILTDGVRTGKHLYVKMDGVVLCEVDDTDGYLTGDSLGTMIADFHVGADIQMDTTYTNEYGTPTVYDIYDLAGSVSKTLPGTNAGTDWNYGELVGNANADHKENMALRTKVTMASGECYRLSFGALADAKTVDPMGYGFAISLGYNGNNSITFYRNNSWIHAINLTSEQVAAYAGTWEMEYGYQDILFGNNVIGKRVYLKKDGVEVMSYEDKSGYLTGNTLGTKIATFTYGNGITMQSLYETTYGTPTVYDIFDLTGAAANTIKGTNDTWDGQIRADISAEHKENMAFKTKLTADLSSYSGNKHIRLSLNALEGSSHTDPEGYAVYLYLDSNTVDIRRNNSSLKSATVDNLTGTYIFEAGIVDILFGGNRIGKHLYVKINDVVVCEYDDTNGYLTGNTLGTKLIDFHYGPSIQMDTTYATTYGTPHTYDIYDLTGAVSKTQIGTATTGNWSTGEKVGSIDAAHKENMELRANVTVNQGDRYRFSFGALDSANYLDLAGYGFELSLGWSSQYYLWLTRNGTKLKEITFADAADYVGGAWKMEFGYVDVLINGDVVGKRIYLKKDGVEIISCEDGTGFLTGDALGLGVGVFTYGNSVTLQSLYETTYADVNVYDIYDLTNAATNYFYGALGSQAGGSDDWDGTNIGDVASDKKENIALKAKVTIDSVALYGTQTDLIRLSLGALDAHTVADCHGYALRVYKDGSNWYYAINTDNNTTLAKSAAYSESNILGTYELEFGYQDILLNESVIGKRIYLKKDGAEIVSWEVGSGYLTGDTLGTNVNFFSMGQCVTMETLYETSYGEMITYDVYDLTGKTSNVFYGTSGSSVGGHDEWSGTTIGNVKAADKENVNFKAQVTVPAGVEIRFSLGALDSANAVDYAGYALMIKDNSFIFYRNNKDIFVGSADMTGTYVLEFGIQDVMVNGEVVSKRITLKRDGAVVGTYDDASGYLTGGTLGTKVAVFHYGSSITMDTTLPVSFVHGYNLTLGGRTVINLYLNPEIIGDPSATITVKVEGEKATQTYNLQDLPTNADGYRIVNVKLASGQMNDAVTVTAIPGSGEPMSKVYSVAGYVKYVLGENYSEDLKQLARDLLHYGAAAQKYFDYNADSEENLANYGIEDTETNTITAPAKSVEGSVDGVAIYGASLILRDDTTLRYYLNITGDVNDYIFSINGEEAAPRKVSGTGVNYCVQYDGILPNRLGDVYTLIISKGSDTMAVNYSPTVYMKNIYGKGGEAQDLAQQLYDYYCSAEAYAGPQRIDTPVVLDLYQVSGQTSVMVPGNQPFHLGMLMDTDDGLVKTELTSNMAIRFKYTGGEGMRIQIGATTPDLSVVSGGALFMSVPDNNSFGIANILDNGTWCDDANGNDLFSWQSCLGRDQSSYIELGCVKVYTNGEYTHDRYYVRAAASLEELNTMAQNGTFSVYYDTAMKNNNGNRVIVRSRLENGGDVLATTWTDEAVTAYENSLKSAAQNATSGDYDKLAEKYPELVTDTSNTAESLAAAKKPTGSTTATGGDELILWAESGASKIVQDDDGKAATQAAQKNTLSIQMAKNESEGAQLMLFGNRNVEAYEIFVTDLTSGSNVITADNIRLYQLKYLTVDGKRSDDTTYDTPSQYIGEKLPDAMLPFAKAVEYGENVILAGNNQAIYVDVTADRNVVAGTYNGTIVVKTNTDQVYTLDISVVVRDVVMPDTSKLGTYAPYLNRDAFSSGELDGSDEMAALYVQTLESFNMSSIAPTSDGVMNLEKFLVSVRRNYDPMTNYLLPVDSNESYYNGEPVYCNYALLREYVVELAKMSIADGKNYLDKAFFYPSDHVDEAMTSDEFALAQETYTVFRQVLTDADAELTAIYAGSSKYTAQIASSVKNLRFLLTVPSDDSVGKSLAIGDLLDEYFPKTNADNKNVVLCTTNDTLVRPKYYGDSIKEAVGDDRELWTYLCLKPFYPHSNYAFDTPVVGLRTLGWTCYQEGIDTLMTWKSVSYLYDDSGLSLDRWTTSIFGEDYFTPGDGNMFYPGAKYGIDGACPSLRAMAWRDGVDDYNLMSAVVENGGSAASLNSLYSLITKAGYDYVKLSGSGLGSLITRQIEATHPIDDDAKFIIVRNALLQMAASNASEHAIIVANAQTAVNGVTAATGTTNALESPVSESTATITGNIYTDGYYQLADFETYEETIQNKFMGNAQLALSDLTQDGGYSLQVAVQPGQDGETVWIPTTSKYFSATTNFSSASTVTFKVYNAQNAGSTVRFYLNTYNRANDEYGVYSAGTYNKTDADIWHDDHPQNAALRFSLEHGWNEITIDMADIGVDLSYVGAFIIAFDSGVGCDAQQVFYLDDVRVYMNKVS
ncbi:MAG: DUF4091 domain-containing protein [Oscillospiraceae bacterium]|nr:DUF4091 domain-containing protein [Oscillospiraceae bacterium]